MDLWRDRAAKPMLIGEEGAAFDSPDFIYELKLDGERCLAYLDPKEGTELINKRGVKMLPKVPELAQLHKHVKKRCILDGELAVIKDGMPDFYEIQRRSLMSNRIKIDLAAQRYPACFTAFDILYEAGQDTGLRPLMERKALLSKTVRSESGRFAVSRYIETNGVAMYELTKRQGLEGVVAKRRDSLYFQGKRTRDWIKCKNLLDDDFVVCGYIHKDNNIISIVLGQYRDGQLVYKGHVTMGVSGEPFRRIASAPEIPEPVMEVPAGHGNENAVWLEPSLVCTVKYMMKTNSGGLRQPVLKGLRDDKKPQECVES